MSKRYAIWDKQSQIITPVGEVLTAEEWKARYPVARLDNITIICSAGEINGGFFGTLGQMKKMCEDRGADFSSCKNDQEVLDAIEVWEEAQSSNVTEPAPDSEERIAAALEYQNLLAM